MTVTALTPRREPVSARQAREELSKFFAIADLAEQAPEMFSKFIDAEWHRMMQDKDAYAEFCETTVGHHVGHVQDQGHGTPSWLVLYHERFGTLSTAWFASAEGIVDFDAYNRYVASRTGVVAWHCTPTAGDPDLKPHVITSWDCTPTTGDPDYARTHPAQPDALPPVIPDPVPAA